MGEPQRFFVKRGGMPGRDEKKFYRECSVNNKKKKNMKQKKNETQVFLSLIY